jgi:hypothetical protein
MLLAVPLLFRPLGRKKCTIVGARIIVMGIDRGQSKLHTKGVLTWLTVPLWLDLLSGQEDGVIPVS